MSISRVRAQISGVWYTLTYNSATDLYETTVTPGTVSSGQSGGYYNVTVEASGSAGGTATANGSTLPGLRLVVQDMTPPVLALVSPPEGYLTGRRPTVVMTATDEAGGSGIEIGSLSVLLDGAAQSGAAATAVTGGYRITWTPAKDLPDGPHQITVSVRDKQGNLTTRTLSYGIDTTAPTLTLVSPAEGFLKDRRPVIRILAADNAGGAGIRGDTLSVTLDGMEQVSGVAAEATAQGLSIAYTPPELAEGAHTVRAAVQDYNGNGTSLELEYFVDTVAPALAVLAPAPGYLTERQNSFAMALEDSGSGLELDSLEVTLDGSVVTPAVTGSTATVTVDLDDGPHTLAASVADRAGNVGTLSAEYVVDTLPPVLRILSPVPGYVAENPVEFVLEASDAGSGIAPGSLAAALDGAPLEAVLEDGTAQISVHLEEGRHTLTASVTDRAGREAALTAEYIVDTVPPELVLTAPDNHRVVDDETVTVTGTVFDATSPPCTVRITVDGIDLGEAEVEDGAFFRTVPLEVGVHEIVVTARDGAGLTTSRTVTMIRLVTDREPADVERVLDLCRRGYDSWTAEERAWWASTPCRRGSYDALDLNRVTAAMDWISGWLEAYGYEAGHSTEPHRPWTEADDMTAPQGERYLQNVESLRAAVPLLSWAPETPEDMEELFREGGVYVANEIEMILVAVDAVRPAMDGSVFYAGEIDCGEV